VVRAEGGATQTVGILPQVLLMQQLEGGAFSAQPQMRPGPVGLGPGSSRRGRRRIKERFEAVDFAVTMRRMRRSRCGGFRGHDAVDWAVRIARNMHVYRRS